MPKYRFSVLNIYLLLLFILVSSTYGQAQEVETVGDSLSDILCPQKDMRDLFHRRGRPFKPPRKTMLLILPTVSSNPANGLMAGIGGSAGWFMGPTKYTRVSSATFKFKISGIWYPVSSIRNSKQFPPLYCYNVNGY